jgi:hypothetical protein
VAADLLGFDVIEVQRVVLRACEDPLASRVGSDEAGEHAMVGVLMT